MLAELINDIQQNGGIGACWKKHDEKKQKIEPCFNDEK